MSDDPLDYQRLAQRALLGVVRDALRIVSEEGLPGEHHLYLTFRSPAPGVRLPARLLAEYPQEMTIVLQHLFWELAVDEEKFSVKLRFGGTLEYLEVPFAALTAFVDPSAQFGLRFEVPAPPETATVENKPAKPKAAPKAGPQPLARRERAAPRPAPAPAKRPARAAPRAVTPASGTKVVDLASFRKATGEREGDEPGDDAS